MMEHRVVEVLVPVTSLDIYVLDLQVIGYETLIYEHETR